MSCASAELGFAFGDGLLGGYSLWMAPTAAFLTFVLDVVTLAVWKHTDKKRKGTTKPSFIYSVTLCVLSCLLAVLWLGSLIVAFLFVGVSVGGSDSPSPSAWLEAIFTLVNGSLMWAIFGMVVYHRKQFLKNARELKRQQAQFSEGAFLPPQQMPMPIHQQQPQQPPQNLPFLTSTKLEAHTKWILALIITGMVLCLVELGISFGDGAFGGYSLWMAPIGAILTGILHIVTLPVWKHTAKKRKGTPKPSSIYSVTLCVLTCLLAVYWKVTAIIAFILSSIVGIDDFYGPYNTYGEVVLPWIVAVIALILSGLMWAEFALVVHFRHRFLKRVKRARAAGHLPPIHIILVNPAYAAPPPYGANQSNFVAFQQQSLSYQYGQHQQPSPAPPADLMKDTPPVPAMPDSTSPGYFTYPPQPYPVEKSGQ
ncbi:hypothetical protein FRC19_008586 [Serendipita sp. 401]|nr:hypothetical protein FRC19_008586 [Serendipita sp. 401]KAG8867284.1 hypothetical protein FRC20_006194 [Serendipita sp. 405]